MVDATNSQLHLTHEEIEAALAHIADDVCGLSDADIGCEVVTVDWVCRLGRHALAQAAEIERLRAANEALQSRVRRCGLCRENRHGEHYPQGVCRWCDCGVRPA